MICHFCEGDIIGRRSDTKYCSVACKAAAEKRRQRERKGLAVNPQRGPYDGRSSSRRNYSLMYKFGITSDQYEQLLSKQGGNCAVCERHHTTFNKRLAVDHNHKTGEIRGLLCGHCNHRLVGRHTDGAVLRKMADYVEQGTGWFVPTTNPKKRRRKK